MSNLKVIVPMAGKGSRFQAVAETHPKYRVPKPLIQVNNKPMMWWALSSLKVIELPGLSATSETLIQPSDVICIIQKEHQDRYKMADSIHQFFGEEVTVVEIPEVTRGAAETVLTAKEHLQPDDQVIILDSDTVFDGTPLINAITNKSADVKGIIPVFKPASREPRYSYTLFDQNNKAIAVGEKDPALAAKGAYANLGAYYFSEWNTFAELTTKMISTNEKYGPEGKQEFYIAPLFQKIIERSETVTVAVIDTVHHLGTPEELELFLNH